MHVGFLRSRPPDTPHRISLRLAARLLRLPLKGGVIAWERGRPARILSLWPPLSFSAMLQAATLSAGTIGQAEGEPWRRSRLIQVGEMAEAVPGFVRAGRPRSQEAIIP